MNVHALTEQDLVGASQQSHEPDWLRDRRLTAFKRYLDQEWPNSRTDEFWRSTPFDRRFNVDRDVVAVPSPAPATMSVTRRYGVDAVRATIVDGTLTAVHVPDTVTQQGVVVADLKIAATTYSDLVQPHLGAMTTTVDGSSGDDEDRTVTVNDAAWTAGVFIHVPADVELDMPIEVHTHVATPGAHLTRVLAVVGTNAKATVYLDHSSEQGVDALVDEVVEVIAQDGADVQFASLQTWQDGIQHLALHKIAAHRDTSIKTLAVTTGGTTVRLRPEVDLLGPGASARPLGIYFADEGQWFDLQPYVRHLAPRASSDVLFKGALQGHSRTVFRGNVFVHRDAVGTATDENNRSLILTEGARADSTPFLEIECADITAGHGSATGQIDALHLYYLQSRGIRRDDALRLIVAGFFREVLDEANLPAINEAALAVIEARIEAADLSAVQINDAALRELAAQAST